MAEALGLSFAQLADMGQGGEKIEKKGVPSRKPEGEPEESALLYTRSEVTMAYVEVLRDVWAEREISEDKLGLAFSSLMPGLRHPSLWTLLIQADLVGVAPQILVAKTVARLVADIQERKKRDYVVRQQGEARTSLPRLPTREQPSIQGDADHAVLQSLRCNQIACGRPG